ncbi:calmodulin-like [Diorhabda sublineata]|nr:calmodulin-like [Diorhabda sublineata]
MRALGVNPTEAELLVFIKEIVPEQDGTINIDFPEFLTFMGRQMKNIKDEEELREAFRIFDKDGTGYISAKELHHIITHLGEPLSRTQVNRMMIDADTDEDGQINYEDFVTLITSSYKMKSNYS